VDQKFELIPLIKTRKFRNVCIMALRCFRSCVSYLLKRAKINCSRTPKVTAPVTFGFSRQKVSLLSGSRYLSGSCYLQVAITFGWLKNVFLDCKTVVFFANASDGQYSNERSGASVKTARENGERRACEARALHTRGSRLPKTSENDCFAVYFYSDSPLRQSGRVTKEIKRSVYVCY